MSSFQATQSEQIVLESDIDEYVLHFNKKPNVLIVQVRDKMGADKSLKVIDGVITANGKTVLKAGDIISYIAVM